MALWEERHEESPVRAHRRASGVTGPDPERRGYHREPRERGRLADHRHRWQFRLAAAKRAVRRRARGAAGSDAAQARNSAFGGVFLSNFTALGYSTYVQQNNGGQAPYIILTVDYDNNGTADDLLFFEPLYQAATFFPSSPQGPLALNT